MNIALDMMGGDFAPLSNVEGVKLAIDELPVDANLLLVGKSEEITPMLGEDLTSSDRIQIIHAEQVIEMAESPTKAITQKPNSSIAIGYGLLKAQKADAFCSAGNTGAMMVGGMFSVKAAEGVIRPALASLVPKLDGSYGIILDIGANSDCKPDVLVQFGELGSLYAEHVMDIKNPKVGLINLGEEELKGNLLTQAAHQLLKINQHINFIGNIEGRDLFNDKADVIVCDGFTGNVVLKLSESFYAISRRKKIKDAFFEAFNYESIGGSPILGINSNVLIGHGISSPVAIKNMLIQANKMAESHIQDKIKKMFGN